MPLYVELDYLFGSFVLLDWIITSCTYKHDGEAKCDCSFELCITKLVIFLIISIEFCVWGGTLFLDKDFLKVIDDRDFGNLNQFLRGFLFYRITIAMCQIIALIRFGCWWRHAVAREKAGFQDFENVMPVRIARDPESEEAFGQQSSDS